LIDDDDDDEWQESVLRGDDDGSALRPVQAVCFYDSTQELRGAIDECWQDLRASFDDVDSAAELRELQYARENLGIRIDIDTGLEVSACFYPVIAGEPRDDLAPGYSQVLLQLHDDGGGSVDPGQLGELLEWLLEDIVADAAHLDLRMGDERFADGERPLVLCDTSGQLLEMPAGLAGDY
jgi:hypothetical protein